MSTVINLFAGPGAGKSTLAAEIFWRMKVEGLNCELVREYVKDWAYEGRDISGFDQFYVTGKQIKKESLLYGKVDYIITDCPLWNGAFYEQHLEGTGYMASHIRGFTEYAERHGVQYHNYLMSRQTEYDPLGRFQTEEEALAVDKAMREFLDKQRLTYTYLNMPTEDMGQSIVKRYLK